MNAEQVFEMIKTILVDEFELDASEIVADADIFTDLDIDSIDLVDLIVKLRSETGKTIEPDGFKQVRTIQDLVNAILAMVND